MSLLAVGVSHQTAPVALLERFGMGREETVKALHELVESDHVSEAVLLATCNRVEVFAEVDRFHGGVTDVSRVLARQAGSNGIKTLIEGKRGPPRRHKPILQINEPAPNFRAGAGRDHLDPDLRIGAGRRGNAQEPVGEGLRRDRQSGGSGKVPTFAQELIRDLRCCKGGDACRIEAH